MKMKRLLGVLLGIAIMLVLMLGLSVTAYADDTSYLDENGVQQTAYANVLASSTTAWYNDNWYVAIGNVTISGTVTTNQNVRLILADDATLTINNILPNNNNTNIKSLTIYAQSTGEHMGKLIINNSNGYGMYIRGNLTINGGDISVTGTSQGILAAYGDLTINGGKISATGTNTNSSGIMTNGISGGGNMTVNGGSVTASGDKYGIQIANNSNKLTLNGGTVTATGNTQAVYANSVVLGTGVTVMAGDNEASATNVTSTFPNSHSQKYVYAERPAIPAVESLTVSPTSATLIVGNEAVPLTADVTLGTATDGTVKWSIGGTNPDSVALYFDAGCTQAVGMDATSAITVYAKGLSSGSATVTVTSNADETMTADCAVTVKEMHSVNLIGGANTTADPSTGISQSDLTDAMTTVTYTANSGYRFPATSDCYKTTSGITVARTSDTVVTVSGTPTADVTVTVPDAFMNPISRTVTFKVVNGSWDDSTTGDKIIILTGEAENALYLTEDQIPAVGEKPASGYMGGTWDPSPDTAITGDTTFTYSFGLPYLIWNGSEMVEADCTDCTFVTGSTTTWGQAGTVSWYVVNNTVSVGSRITTVGDVRLILANGATLDATRGISVNEGNSLTIYAQSTDENTMGALNATGYGTYNIETAGIGGDTGTNSGSITIHGGKITAIAGKWYAGSGAAGIGGGGVNGSSGSKGGSGGNITINGGIVTAYGCDPNSSNAGGAGIGGGNGGSSGSITINGGTVTASGEKSTGAGIGGGRNGSADTITINGGAVTATGGAWSAGIGGGQGGSGGTIIIQDGNVEATGGSGSAGIGGGSGGSGGSITINGGTVNAKGTNSGSSSDYRSSGAGIGGGRNGSGGIITITAGTVTAAADADGAGIGSGSCGTAASNGSGGTVTISGGTVTATGGSSAAGIGGGYYSDGADVTITGGTVKATGTDGYAYTAVAIGGGYVYPSADNKSLTLGEGMVAYGGADADHTEVIDKLAGDYERTKYMEVKAASVPVTGLTLTPASAELIVGEAVKLTAEIAPADATNRTVIWSVSGSDPVKLYADERCTTEIAAGEPSVRTVYAKGMAAGTPTVTATSGVNSSASAQTAISITNPNSDPVSYMDWNGYRLVPMTGDDACLDYSVVTSSTTALENGKWYVVSKDMTVVDRITVSGTAHLILMDGKTLTAKQGITVGENDSLTIYGQTNGSGALIATNGDRDAAIGGVSVGTAGTIIINGGDITATNSNRDENVFPGAGIGGGGEGGYGTIIINGGTINAHGGGGYGSAGIGGGSAGDAGGSIIINGGDITATGGRGGAGIGNGCGALWKTDGPTVTINGGSITANGGYMAAGIGGGYDRSGGTITINGGAVTANGNGAPGIGGGDTDSNISTDNGTVVLGAGVTVYAGSSANPTTDVTGSFAENHAQTYVVVEPHIHSFEYTASGASVTATCTADGCILDDGTDDHNHAVTLSIAAPTLNTYGQTGEDVSANATLSGLDAFNAALGLTLSADSIQYFKAAKDGDIYTRTGEALTGAPTGAGDYLAEIPVDTGESTVTASVGYTVARAAIAAPALSMEGYAYGAATVPAPSIDAQFTHPEEAVPTYYYNTADSTENGTKWENITGTSLNANAQGQSYYMYAVYPQTGNYEACTTATRSFTVSKGDRTAPDAPTKAAITVSSVTLTAVDGCEYSKDGTNWQDSPSFTGLTMGTQYSFYQRLKETDNYNASPSSAAASISTHAHEWSFAAGTGEDANTVTAACANTDDGHGETLTATLTLSAAGGTYDGTTAYGATVTGSIEGVDTPAVSYYAADDEGEKTGEALTGAPTGAGSYWAELTLGTATAHVVYTVEKAAPTANAPTGVTATYGQTLRDVALTNPSGNTPGAWAWVQDGTTSVGSAGYRSFKASFTPEDTANYKGKTDVDVTVFVGKAENPATVTTTATVMRGGHSVDLMDNVILHGAMGTVIFAFDNERNGCTLTNDGVLTSGANMGTVIVNVAVAADDNHFALPTKAITVTITDKNAQTIAADDVAATYGDTDKSVSASVTEPAADGGAISYAVKEGSGDYIAVDADTGALTILAVPEDGIAYVTVTAAETQTHERTTKDVSVTISKANSTAAAVAANEWICDWTENALVSVDASTLAGGTMYYALGTDAETAPDAEAYTAEIPTAVGAGCYYVWSKVVGDGNHLDTAPTCVSVEIGAPAFGEASFTLPAGIKSIEESAFEGLPMTVVEIPSGCESIGKWAFKDCTGLKQIRIPLSVTAIDETAFDGCANVLVYGTSPSAAETFCKDNASCTFVTETTGA